jgi:hypothetical protein
VTQHGSKLRIAFSIISAIFGLRWGCGSPVGALVVLSFYLLLRSDNCSSAFYELPGVFSAWGR